MAKKVKLTAKKERKLIKAIESQRNSKEKLVESPITISPDATVLLSVRLPYEDARLLRAAAERRDVSLGDYLDSAFASLVASARDSLEQTSTEHGSPTDTMVPNGPASHRSGADLVAG